MKVDEAIESAQETAKMHEAYGIGVMKSRQMGVGKMIEKLKDGVPCGHVGCLNHLSHPCECCGRIGGKSK